MVARPEKGGFHRVVVAAVKESRCMAVATETGSRSVANEKGSCAALLLREEA